MADFTVNLSTLHQTISGWGGSSAFANPYSNSTISFLFSASGIHLTHVRDKISQDGWPQVWPFTGGDEINGTFATLAQCQAAGMWIWGDVWAFQTAWMGGNPRGHLDPSHYSDAVGTVTSYLDRALAAGVGIMAIAFMNEPDFDPGPGHEQTMWTTSEAITFLTGFLYPGLVSWGAANPSYKTLTGQNFPPVMVSDVAQWASLAGWVSAFEGNSTALSEIILYTSHQYAGVASPPATISRPIWETEYSTFEAWSGDIATGLTTAQSIYDAMITGNASLWLYWLLQDNLSNDNQGLIGMYDPNWGVDPVATAALWQVPILTKRAYALGNYSKFVRPGWKRADVSGSKSGIYGVSAYTDPNTGQFAVVVINNSGSPLSVSVSVSGTKVKRVYQFVTTNTSNDVIGTDGNLSAGSATYSVPSTTALSSGVFTATVPPGVSTFSGVPDTEALFFGSGTVG